MIREPVRLTRTLLHVAEAAWKLHAQAPRWSEAERRARVARWSREVFAILGIDLDIEGVPAEGADGPVMVVANHVSWLDVFALLAAGDMEFVAKSEVADWPVIGALARRMRTAFVDRNRRASSRTVTATITERLAAGAAICVFPEGTTTAGDRLAPFRAPLLEAAVCASARVQPVAIRYLDAEDDRSDLPAFVGDMSLHESLWQISRASGLRAEVRFLPVFATHGFDRRAIAARAERAIADHLGVGVRPNQELRPLEAGDGAIAFDFAAR